MRFQYKIYKPRGAGEGGKRKKGGGRRIRGRDGETHHTNPSLLDRGVMCRWVQRVSAFSTSATVRCLAGCSRRRTTHRSTRPTSTASCTRSWATTTSWFNSPSPTSTWNSQSLTSTRLSSARRHVCFLRINFDVLTKKTTLYGPFVVVARCLIIIN